jgi:hypothetical protein
MVGVHEVCFDVQVGDHVRPGDVHRRQRREDARVGGVGTVVDQHRGTTGGDRAVVGDPGLEVDHHALTAAIRGEELLTT